VENACASFVAIFASECDCLEGTLVRHKLPYSQHGQLIDGEEISWRVVGLEK